MKHEYKDFQSNGSCSVLFEPGAMSYTMSKNQYFGDIAGHWHSHLMFPRMDAASWGANPKPSVRISGERLHQCWCFPITPANEENLL